MKSKHGAMTIEQLIEIDKKIGRLHENRAPSIVPERSVGETLARFLARRMASNPDVDISDTAYIQEYIQSGFTRFSAKRIVKKARNLATDLPPMPNPKGTPPATQETSHPSPKENVADSCQNVPSVPRPDSNLPAVPIPESDLTDYVKALPETLPRPTQIRERENNIKTRGFFTLKTLRNEFFATEKFKEAIEYQVDRTSANPFGFYQLSASAAEKQRYAALWDAIGHNDVPPIWFPAILPYLAEEGLLEYHQVGLELVKTLEEQRQSLIRHGLLQEYNRDVPFKMESGKGKGARPA